MKFLIIILLIVLFPTSIISAETSGSDSDNAEYHIRQGNKLLINDRPFEAIEEFKKAVKKGTSEPVLYRNYAIVLYDLGFLDEAIVYMQKALSLSPYANSFQMELGIIFLAKENLETARYQFMEVLNRNPGFANAYYYLGETYYRMKDYDMAWMFSKMAKNLKHRGSSLPEKLSKVSQPPNIDLFNDIGDKLFIRQILVDTDERAANIVTRISSGELFENIASELDKSLSSVGGFLGYFKHTELHPKIASALRDRKVFSDPVIVQTELGFHIVQRIVPFDFNKWERRLARYREKKKPKVITAKLPEKQETKRKSDKKTIARQPTVRKISMKSTGNELAVMKPATTSVSSDQTPSQKMSRKKYFVYAGAFKLEENAIERIDRLRELGYSGYHLVKSSKKGPLYMVIAGEYPTLQKAQSVGKNIAQHGLEYYISR